MIWAGLKGANVYIDQRGRRKILLHTVNIRGQDIYVSVKDYARDQHRWSVTLFPNAPNSDYYEKWSELSDELERGLSIGGAIAAVESLLLWTFELNHDMRSKVEELLGTAALALNTDRGG